VCIYKEGKKVEGIWREKIEEERKKQFPMEMVRQQ
jgi:hypothetical protein